MWLVVYATGALIWALWMALCIGAGTAKGKELYVQGAIIALFLTPIWPLVFAYVIGHCVVWREKSAATSPAMDQNQESEIQQYARRKPTEAEIALMKTWVEIVDEIPKG